MAKLTVRDLNVRGKRVFVRVDYNVPLEEKDGQMVITDATRIVETLPTLRLLIEQGAKLILAAHLGRPKGKREASMSLRPVAAKLADLLGCPVAFADDCIGPKVEQTVGVMKPGDVLLLENTRYYNEEEANDPAFAEKLAKVADVYVNDAFGAAHRAHASTEGVARVVAKRGGQCAAGLLMERELKFLGEELENPARPFVVILGGAKVSDKIQVIDRLLEKADALFIGGAMAYTFRWRTATSRQIACRTGQNGRRDGGAGQGQTARGSSSCCPPTTSSPPPVNTGKLNKKGKPVIEFQNVRVDAEQDMPGRRGGVRHRPGDQQALPRRGRQGQDHPVERPDGPVRGQAVCGGTIAVAQAVADATHKNGAKSIIGGGDSVKALNKAGLATK